MASKNYTSSSDESLHPESDQENEDLMATWEAPTVCMDIEVTFGEEEIDDADFWLPSSDLIEPLEEPKVPRATDEEDEPTLIALPTIPRPDRVDQFSLTETQEIFFLKNGKKRGEVTQQQLSEEALSNLPLSPVHQATPPPASAPKTSSLAPITMRPEPWVVQEQKPSKHRVKRASIIVLAAAAAAIALWPLKSIPQQHESSAAQIIDSLSTQPAEPIRLDPVEIAVELAEPAPNTIRPAVLVASKESTPTMAINNSKQVAMDQPQNSEESDTSKTESTNSLAAFDPSAAASAMSGAAGVAQSCRQEATARIPIPISITFSPSGQVTAISLDDARTAGTSTGSCITQAFRSARVTPFEGRPVTIVKTFFF